MAPKATTLIRWLATLAFCATGVLSAAAADFPSKPITLIVPWAAGGSTDTCMRVLAENAKKHLGQPVVVENKPGGGGTVGPATMVATAKPDGYTLSQIPMGVFRLPHTIKTTWDPLTDFTWIIQLTGYTYGIVVKSDAPWKTLRELLDYAKANPGKVTYATPGVGVMQHVTMEKLAKKEGINWIHVPQKGGIEVISATMGGHVMVGAETSGWAPQVESGDLRLLAIWTETRSQKWPDVPTLKELGYDIVASSPFGIAGPKGMDPQVVAILHDAFKKAMDEPSFQKVLNDFYMVPAYKNAKDYADSANAMFLEEKENAEILGLKKQ
ncbi:MAG: tripartite tricarboxylate transporter substrate binding protein [Desulfarculus sp.]|nr:tripartite tricarboxylate transporter substrate binding protein [Desulfarculus sp.]